MQSVLLIAYGNPLRSDDGVAWRAAENLRKTLPESIKILCTHQLTPELAEDASRAGLVIFLDASRDGEPGTVNNKEVFAQQGTQNFSHYISPCDLLALCDHVYGATPRAFVVSVSGECFDHGGKLSPAIVKALPQIEATMQKLIQEYACVAGH